MITSILLSSALALPAEQPHTRMNNIVFGCYSPASFEEIKSCAQPKLTKSNGFPVDVDLINGHPALGPLLAMKIEDCFGESKGSLDAFKSCASTRLSFAHIYEQYFDEAYSYKQTVPIEYLPKELKRLPMLVESDVTHPFGLIVSEKQTQHVNFCFFTNIILPFKKIAKSSFAACIRKMPQ